MSTATTERTAKAASIDADLADITANAERDYRNAVVKSASGQSIPQAEVLAVCVAHGRTPQQFADDVKLARKRNEALAVLDGAAKRTAEVDKLHAVSAATYKEIAALDADYKAKRKLLSNRYIAEKAAYDSATAAEQAKRLNAQRVLRDTAAVAVS